MQYYRIYPFFTIQSVDCARGEMDITTVFGTVVPGSNPGGRTSGYVAIY